MSLECLPYFFRGQVVAGFGRGGKQLGCPTANIDDSVVNGLPSAFPCGVFYGLARVESGEVCNMVMSIGWNPHFQNEKKTVEVHLLKEFPHDFYGSAVEAVVLGFIRPMTKFSGLEELKKAIADDISQANILISELDRPSLVAKYFVPYTHSNM